MHEVASVYFTDQTCKLPYRGKLRRGKVTKFSASDEIFPRRNFSPAKFFPDEVFPDKVFPYYDVDVSENNVIVKVKIAIKSSDVTLQTCKISAP